MQKQTPKFKIILKDMVDDIVSAIIVVLILWLAISCTVFRFRHPWATETETILNVHNALLFKKVSYDEMRPREAR